MKIKGILTKVARTLFAPIFWIRDIRELLEKVYRTELIKLAVVLNGERLTMDAKSALLAVARSAVDSEEVSESELEFAEEYLQDLKESQELEWKNNSLSSKSN